MKSAPGFRHRLRISKMSAVTEPHAAMSDPRSSLQDYIDIVTALVRYTRRFVTSSRCWLIFARNLIPVAGLLLFGWSLPLVVFNYWTDGLVGLAALFVALMVRFYWQVMPQRNAGAVVALAVIGGIFIGMFGIPYWLTLFSDKNGDLNLMPTLLLVFHSPALLLTFVVSAAGNLWRSLSSNIVKAEENVMIPQFGHELSLVVGRGMLLGMFLEAHVPLAVVPLMAVAITILEAAPIMEPSLIAPKEASA
jgi:hypothetical protein